MMSELDTKRLRQKLLDLAVRGKLVSQDPNDEPASELIARIHTEKQEMVKAGKLKQKDIESDTVIYTGSNGLHYERQADGKGKPICIENEIPFDLPCGWCWTRLGSICIVLNGDRGKNYPAKAKLHQSGIPFVSALNIANGLVVKDNMLYMDAEQYKLLRAGKLAKDDIVFCIRGSLGKHGFFPYNHGAIASSLVIVRSLIDNQDLRIFIDTLFGSSLTNRSIEKFSSGVAQPNLAAKDFESFLYPLPPLAEQQRIIAILHKCLTQIDAIEQNGNIINSLRLQLRSKVLDLAMRGKLVQQFAADEPASDILKRIHTEKLDMIKTHKLKPKDIKGDTLIYRGTDGLHYEIPANGKGEEKCIEDEIPFEIPTSWSWARFSTLVYQIGNNKNRIEAKRIKDKGPYPVISQSSTAIFDGYCSEDEAEPIENLPVLLFGDHTKVVKYINQPFVIGADGTKCLKAIQIYPPYLYRAMQRASETIPDRGYNRHFSELRTSLIPVPPTEEQRRIALTINSIFRLID